MKYLTLKKIIRWVLFAIIATFIITGFGITRWQIIEMLTFGILTKALSFKIHTNLIIPMLCFLIWHMFYKEINKIIKLK